ncbi:MAG: molybdenum cofactor guanylyltransferase [Propionibacteriales bacterium]|nr:molybdenum cofactor guanylyltransferase [Propionibacteriales bacterium]
MITAAAVVLTGGRSTRFGSHKPAAVLAGRTLVGHVLHAVATWPVVVVGSGDGVPSGIEVVSEQPAGGGPVAAVAEGVRQLPATDVIVLLAGDLPRITHEHLTRLVTAADETGLACFVDGDGQPQWLCAAWRTDLLAERLATLGDPAGQSLRRLANDLPRTNLVDPTGATAQDVDTPHDLLALHDEQVAAVRDGYRPPALSEPTFIEDGAPVRYGERCPGMPPEDWYSRDSHPERFAPLREVADAVVAHLAAHFAVTVTEGVELATVLSAPPDLTEMHRAVRVTPADDRCAAVTFVMTIHPLIWLHAGALYAQPIPTCTCDACDESLLGMVDQLTGRVFDIVAGGFAEHVIADRQHGGPGRSAVEVGNTFPQHSGAALLTELSDLAAERAARLIPDGHRVWHPWPRRRAAPRSFAAPARDEREPFDR